MCINIIPTAPWSPWRNEEQHPPHRLQCGLGRRVVEARTEHVSAPGPRGSGPRSRLSGEWCSETSTAQYIIKHKKSVRKPASSCEKRLSRTCPGVSSSPPSPPPDKGPKEKPSTTHPKMPSHKISHYQCAAPGTDPIGKPPSANPVHRTHAKDSHPKPASDRALTPSRTRI